MLWWKKLKKVQKEIQPNGNDQQWLHEIERQIDMLVGCVQANPMSRGTTANNERIAQLTIEKQALLKQMEPFSRPCPYEGMIESALINGKIKDCIMGQGKYSIPSKRKFLGENTDYETLLENFDLYQQRHPGQPLKETYEQVLEEMLRSDNAEEIHCAVICALEHKKMEQHLDIAFHRTDKEKIEQLIEAAMKRYKEIQ